ncbi:reverse transcriptase domain-containing protein [Tanacetum coccineum]
MPFGLKNAGATYQWLVDGAFRSQIGKNLKKNQHEAKPKEMLVWSHGRKVPGVYGYLRRHMSQPCKNERHSENAVTKNLGRNANHGRETSGVKPLPVPVGRKVLYIDGAASTKGFVAGLVLISPTKTEYTYALRLNFKSTNNQAKYEALLAGLRIAKKMGVQSLAVNVDSKLVASQINGNYKACKENMIRYLNKAKEYIGCFKNFKIQNIPRNKNEKADMLSKLALVAFNHLTKEILVETLDVPSMDVEEINAVVEEEGET